MQGPTGRPAGWALGEEWRRQTREVGLRVKSAGQPVAEPPSPGEGQRSVLFRPPDCLSAFF